MRSRLKYRVVVSVLLACAWIGVSDQPQVALAAEPVLGDPLALMAELDTARLRLVAATAQAQQEAAEQHAAAATLAAEIANLHDQLNALSAENSELEQQLAVDDLAVLRQQVSTAGGGSASQLGTGRDVGSGEQAAATNGD